MCIRDSPNYTPPENPDQPDQPGTNSNNDSPQNTANQDNFSYEIWGTPESPTIIIWGDTILLDPEEAKAMKDPDVMENWINADTYFRNAGLTSIWRNYRHEIVQSMNMSGWDIQINLNDDSLWKLEFIKFAQCIDKTCSWIQNVLDSNWTIPLQLFIKWMVFHWKHRSIIKSISWSSFTKRKIFQSRLL